MRINIEGKKYSLFIDYDRANLISLSYRGKLKYFKLRVKKILINPLKILTSKAVFNKLEPANGSSVAWLCIISLICSGIEALGGFYKGIAQKDSFLSFMYRYMNPAFKNRRYKKLSYGECIREYFRNGLAHGFCIKNGGVEHFNKYFEIHRFGLQINPRYFLNDFLKAFSGYIIDLYGGKINSKIAKNFLKRFKDIFILGK